MGVATRVLPMTLPVILVERQDLNLLASSRIIASPGTLETPDRKKHRLGASAVPELRKASRPKPESGPTQRTRTYPQGNVRFNPSHTAWHACHIPEHN